MMELKRKYKGEMIYKDVVCGYEISLPIRKVDKNIFIASDHDVLEDVSLISKCAYELAERIKKYKPEVILVPESKGLGMAYFISNNLELPLAIAKKGIKAHMEDPVVSRISSITTKGEQTLVLDKTSAKKIENKKCALGDDVISTGETMRGLMELCDKTRGEPSCIGVIWIEGEDRKDFYGVPIESLSYLPIWILEE
jgi:adenine phosphoribosyltransferase